MTTKPPNREDGRHPVRQADKPASPLAPAARREYRRLCHYYPPFFYPGYLQKIVCFHLILRTLDRHHVAGDVVECGVGRGLSFFALGLFMEQLGMERRLYGYDSFQGFPAPSPEDASNRNPVRGDVWAETSVEHVAQHFRDAGLETFLRTRVSLVPGFFEETLAPPFEFGGIALLHLDVDLYESYRVCMRRLGDRVTGLIVYDEYGSPKWPGATLAVDELLPALGHSLFRSDLTGRHFSVPAAAVRSPFGETLLNELQAQAVERGRGTLE
ncbi:MAG: hypothetical protein JXR37_36720 [Kiritimatiellae bacterium]|nr:hypothetical protein [Kiritimatiellia bacterium]